MKTTRALLPLAVLMATVFAAAAQEPSDRPRGWLGIFLDNENETAESDDALGPAVVVRAVVEEGPAAEAGLRARDRIVAVDGQPVGQVDELIARIGASSPGTWVPITVRRGDRERDLRVRLGTRPERTGSLEIRRGWIGAEAIDLPPPLREHFGAPAESGVMIWQVEPASPAEAAGLEVGDVVYEIDGEDVSGTGHYRRLIVGGGVGNEIELAIMRDGTEIVLEATIEIQPPPETREQERDAGD